MFANIDTLALPANDKGGQRNKQTKTKNKQTKKTHQYGFQSLLINTEKTTFGKVLFKKDIELLTTFYLVWLFFNAQKLYVKVGKPKLSAFILAVCIKNGHQMVVNNCLLPDKRGPILDLASLNRF